MKQNRARRDRPPGMREDPDARRVRTSQAVVAAELDKLQRQYELTDIEMLQALNAWQGMALKFMLREERNPGNPDWPADAARDGEEEPDAPAQ